MVPFKSLVSYLSSIVTMHLTCIISETARYWWKIIIFIPYPYSLAFDAPVRGSPLEYCHDAWYGKN